MNCFILFIFSSHFLVFFSRSIFVFFVFLSLITVVSTIVWKLCLTTFCKIRGVNCPWVCWFQQVWGLYSLYNGCFHTHEKIESTRTQGYFNAMSLNRCTGLLHRIAVTNRFTLLFLTAFSFKIVTFYVHLFLFSHFLCQINISDLQ